MPRPNPFHPSVFSADLRLAPSGSAPLHEAARAQLRAEIEALDGVANPGAGRLLRLRAQSAGFGKSHLLARVVADCADRSHALPIVFNLESAPSWNELFRQAIGQLSEATQPDALPPLSETARLIFAELIGELVHRGVVPTDNPARAIASLQKNYRSLFDLQNPKSPLIGWFRNNAAALTVPLAGALRHRTRLSEAEARFWIDFLYRFETSGEMAITPEMFKLREGDAKSRMRDLGKLVSRYRPLVMIFDHLDLFFRDSDSGLQAAYLFSEIARIGVAPLSILAINDDLWMSNFEGQVPSAIADRLGEIEIELAGIGPESARALLQERLASSGTNPEESAKFFATLNIEGLFDELGGRPLSPRELLRFAASAWSGEEQPAVQVAPPPGVGAPAVESLSPTAAAAGETLSRIKGMLHGVNQRRTSPTDTGSPVTSVPRPASPWEPLPEEAPAALQAFAKRRESLFFGDGLLFDADAIRQALSLAGRRSPLIEYDELEIDGDGKEASVWRSPGQEILFGFEPAERTPYWRKLVERADGSSAGSSKVVAFTPPGATPAFAPEKLNGHAREHLDVLELDRGTLASIAAAHSVMQDADSEEEAFAVISPELNLLWRRITRPL